MRSEGLNAAADRAGSRHASDGGKGIKNSRKMEAMPTNSFADAKPTNSFADAKPTNSLADAKPTNSFVEKGMIAGSVANASIPPIVIRPCSSRVVSVL